MGKNLEYITLFVKNKTNKKLLLNKRKIKPFILNDLWYIFIGLNLF